MDVCCVPLWLCSLNLTIQLFSNFSNTNMSPYFSIPMIKIRIWISQSLVVSGPFIKFDRVWLTSTKLWPCLSLNPTIGLWPKFTRIKLSLHSLNPTIRFQTQGRLLMDICYVHFCLCLVNLIIQLFSNFPNTNMSPYFSIPMIRIRIWILQSLVVSGPFLKFDIWPTLSKLLLYLSLNPTNWLWP